MLWKKTIGGMALYLNNNLIGWVTSTINGKYFYGFNEQSSLKKELAKTKHEAMLILMKAVGE
jgi:hypothetical protein